MGSCRCSTPRYRRTARSRPLTRSSTASASGLGISPTMLPSARNRTWWANDGGAGVVGDHDDRLAELVDRPAHEGQDLGARPAVEVAGGLVGEDDRRAAGERPGHGDPLLLPARQLGRSVVEPLAQVDGADHVVEPAPLGVAAGEGQRQRDVLEGGERRDEVERLEHEADPVAPEAGQPPLGQGAELDPLDEGLAGGQRVEAGGAVHQRRLARARRSHDRREPTGREADRDVVEGDDRGVVGAVDLAGADGAGGDRRDLY